MVNVPRIAITVGDPAGIGPELSVRLASRPDIAGQAELILYGPGRVIEQAVRDFAPGFKPQIVSTSDLAPGEFELGKASPLCGKAAYDTICRATEDALANRVDAMVTAPVNKHAVNLAGIPFTGHTELIAHLCGVDDFAMMQSAGDLRIAFVTTHIPLAEVPGAVTGERIRRVAGLLRETLVREGIETPRIGVAALNPHAGENGDMGTEDETVVKPALAALLEAGFLVEGPFPPDTLFIPTTLPRFDGLIAMYHDQGHIPFKMVAFDSGVNSTLGLPIIRTSPDHGTAFEIAGRGFAGCGSMHAALAQAIRQARKK